MEAPCRDCPKRYPLCHSECEEYIAFRAERDEMCRRRAEAKAQQETRNARRQRAWDAYVKRKMSR